MRFAIIVLILTLGADAAAAKDHNGAFRVVLQGHKPFSSRLGATGIVIAPDLVANPRHWLTTAGLRLTWPTNAKTKRPRVAHLDVTLGFSSKHDPKTDENVITGVFDARSSVSLKKWGVPVGFVAIVQPLFNTEQFRLYLYGSAAYGFTDWFALGLGSENILSLTDDVQNPSVEAFVVWKPSDHVKLVFAYLYKFEDFPSLVMVRALFSL